MPFLWHCSYPAEFFPFHTAALGQTIKAEVSSDIREPSKNVQAARTESPRDTLASFMLLRDEMEASLNRYFSTNSATDIHHRLQVAEQFRQLLDLSQVASATQPEIARLTTVYLLDIFGRMGLPELEDVPDESNFDNTDTAVYRIPKTPIRIVRIEEGERVGEYLFESRTTEVAPRFFRTIENLPLRSSANIKSFRHTIPQLTGPLFPEALANFVPNAFKILVLDTPLWKILIFAFAGIFLLILIILASKQVDKAKSSRMSRLAGRLFTPVLVILAVWFILPFVIQQLMITGQFSILVTSTLVAISYIAFAWLFFALTIFVFEFFTLSASEEENKLDANLLRLLATILGAIGGIAILAVGGHTLGVPVFSLLAGLGIGGLAVALAIRPTLENLIGGVLLYIDKPVSVGDFCSFGPDMGTVESIGLRSTLLRGKDRALISVPNAQFADMKLVNWAKCDQMLIEEVIGVRYETSADQLRNLIAEIHKMFIAHPRIDNDTVRVNFQGYGDSALQISIRVYAKTHEWNDFFNIREDILFRLYNLVEEAGSGFAFLSHTVYLDKDISLNAGRDKEP